MVSHYTWQVHWKYQLNAYRQIATQLTLTPWDLHDTWKLISIYFIISFLLLQNKITWYVALAFSSGYLQHQDVITATPGYLFENWGRTPFSFLYARLKNGTYYAVAMSVRPSVRLSVRPSVRPRFPDFSSTCFEISIWNLVYAFSRWHDMSSLSCIRIGSIWPSLQPKVGQTYFLQSWPHKSR